jgi:aspartate aminotransferase
MIFELVNFIGSIHLSTKMKVDPQLLLETHQIMLSHLADTLQPSEILKISSAIRERIAGGARVYNLTIGDFDAALNPIPKELEQEIVKAYKDRYTTYPPAEGNASLRAAIANFSTKQLGLNYDFSEVLVASGGRPLIYATYRTIVDEGDKVIYAVPSWNNNHYCYIVGAKRAIIETCPEQNFMPDAAQIEPHLHEAVMLALCAPQNPTGTLFSEAGLAEICRLVINENKRRKPGEKKLYVLFDGMYGALSFGDNYNSPVQLFPEMKPYTIYIDAVSKIFAATGLRVGWCLAPKEVLDKMKSILTHVGAWAPAAEQKGVAAFLENKQAVNSYLKDFQHKLSGLLNQFYAGIIKLKLSGAPVDVLKPEAGIYLSVKIDLLGKSTPGGKTLNSVDDITAYLLDEGGIAVLPFSVFGASKALPWFRISVGTCTGDDINQVLKQLWILLVSVDSMVKKAVI